MNKQELIAFVDDWLSSWTGNRPDDLLEFYTDNVFYLDPSNQDGIKGKEKLRVYFTKLLSKNANWKWRVVEIMPTEKGFVLKWEAIIPVLDKAFLIYGVDIVEMKGDKISRDEIYFDRYNWQTEVDLNKKIKKKVGR
jgi:SnoaL-like protein